MKKTPKLTVTADNSASSDQAEEDGKEDVNGGRNDDSKQGAAWDRRRGIFQVTRDVGTGHNSRYSREKHGERDPEVHRAVLALQQHVAADETRRK